MPKQNLEQIQVNKIKIFPNVPYSVLQFTTTETSTDDLETITYDLHHLTSSTHNIFHEQGPE